jgi:hypothetical protein
VSSAVFGSAGVLLGSLSTSILTIYRERLTTRRGQVARDEQYERDRKAARDTFQRDSIPALQAAISDLIRAAYQELDRVLAELKQTGDWTNRTWETLTLLAGPMPCCGRSWRKPGYSMVDCVPSPPNCATWQAKAYGPKVLRLPSGTVGKRSPCASSSTRSSLISCHLFTKHLPVTLTAGTQIFQICDQTDAAVTQAIAPYRRIFRVSPSSVRHVPYGNHAQPYPIPRRRSATS